MLELLSRNLSGVVGVVITPFYENTLHVDHEGLRRVVRRMEDGDTDVIVPCGGTGEYYALTERERREVVETVIDEVVDTPVVVGIGTGLREAISATEHAESVGAAGVMVHQPVGAGVHPDGVVDYYRAISESTNIGVVAYVRSPMFNPQVLQEIAEIRNVVAVKYAVEDPKSFAIAVQSVRGETQVVWICGSAESWAPSFWAGGATGFTSGIANFAPEVAVAMREALRSENVKRIRESWGCAIEVEALRDRHSGANNVSLVKLASEMLGLCSAAVRPPLAAPSKVDREDLSRLLESWNERIGLTAVSSLPAQ